ncbi:alpha-2,8-polysialyltransferase family protein [Arthrobacter sp. I2-34]|uniref:Alpha-2,8-polysialyltransferase family protein n=1 Tax=Arthrobacter hankyongi TaxID=2904801 RepID=A0ABS9LAR7_9MICC|nr:alpha-2,8-polysialyltransferase family protein [Arthrobacter hankyongi]MCG2623691.1 alpha-2,8-polysialyltransferase family protein [Arthrobacter hankyongi]
MKQLFAVSSLYQCISLAAAIDGGQVPATGGERILVLANNALMPELATPFQQSPGFAEAASRFDRIVDLGGLLWPRRPGQFSPRAEDLATWETLLRSHWQLGEGPLQLWVESIQVNPAVALCRIFAGASVCVHSDGLMSYGPTRNPLALDIAQRLETLLYVDLVPGLVPQLLREHSPALVPVPAAALAAGMRTLAAALPAAPSDAPSDAEASADGASALVLGQYLAELGILTADEEIELHRDMLVKAAAHGLRRCVFKPHPSAGPAAVRSIQAAAADLGLELTVLQDTAPAEVVMLRLQPALVVSAFSTALMTAKYLFGLEAAAVGTGMLLERLSPYQNSNRIPVTIIDAILERGYAAPADSAAGSPKAAGGLQQLVEAVAYCMQPEIVTQARPAAEQVLAGASETGTLRYFKRRRLTSLQLPGGLPGATPGLLSPLRRVRRAARAARAGLTAGAAAARSLVAAAGK